VDNLVDLTDWPSNEHSRAIAFEGSPSKVSKLSLSPFDVVSAASFVLSRFHGTRLDQKIARNKFHNRADRREMKPLNNL
jgi:hypothetical protein